MKLLILGGTEFVGRHMAEAALARGHDVTLFHRGKHGAELFPQAEHVLGDRDGGLDALQRRTWDAVLDTCGYVPRVVRQSAELLVGAAGHYTFVSSVSVYQDFAVPGIDEDYAVAVTPDETVEEVTGETYGPLKILCEQAVCDSFADRALVVRPGLVVGPHDKTGRFTCWPRRVADGGDFLAPGRPDERVQFIDARDLAAWTVSMIERRVAGTFNAVSDDSTWTMGRLLDECQRAGGVQANPVWADDAWLLGEGLKPWTDLPLWLPDTPEWAGADSVSAVRAVAHGLTFRPLAETVADTLAWDKTLATDDRPVGPKAGIMRDQERALLVKIQRNFGPH